MTGLARLPQVSVVMAVYNGEMFLAEAIRSILNQTLQDFEFIIVDDGSCDKSRQVIQSFDDNRILRIDNVENVGLAKSLNAGMKLARGKYVVRMDCDDICFPERLHKQMIFMEKNLHLGASGTWMKTFGVMRKQVCKSFSNPEEASASLLFNTPLLHPTAIFRRELFARHQLFFDETFRFAQDYDLWERASHYMQLGNLPETLLRYRVHQNQVGTKFRSEQTDCADQIRGRQLHRLGLQVSPAEMSLHRKISMGQIECSEDFLKMASLWMEKIDQANEREKVFEYSALKKILGQHWLGICYFCWKLGPVGHEIFLDSPLAKYTIPETYTSIKYFLKFKVVSKLSMKMNNYD